MPKYLAALIMLVLVGLVVTRVWLLRRHGIRAMRFGGIDRTDFLIPPFALFYIYAIAARAFGWPTVAPHLFWRCEIVAWLGVGLCAIGLCVFVWALVSFGRSFRVGIDRDEPGALVTSGAFARSRNPVYVAFVVVLLGQFLVSPGWVTLVYLGAAAWLFHRQIRREEGDLRRHYGQQYIDYSHRVRRYL